MRIEDLEIGKIYLFDPVNETKQIESGINFVKLESFRHHIFYKKPVVSIISNTTGQVLPLEQFETEERYLVELDMNNPRRNIVVRYPSDLPVLSSTDLAIITKLSDIVMSDPRLKGAITEPEMIQLLSTLKKVEFYTTISEKYRPDRSVIEDDENGE